MLFEHQTPDDICDGGDLDCGSGLLLIIKKHMDPLDIGQVLEIRSREPTVADDLPAWCRMVKHEFIGSKPNENGTSYFVKKGLKESALQEEQQAARGYQWTVRVQGQDGLRAKAYARNHAFFVGQPADFSAQVDDPSAMDYLLAALSSCLTVGFKAIASRKGLTLDAVECTLKGGLDNVLYHMGLEETGHPAVKEITGTFFVSSPDDEDQLEALWQLTLDRSPVYQTLRQNVDIDIKFSIVL